MHQTTITFPDLRLSQRDGHKLRGYFSRQFGADSDLWHNHRPDGSTIYRYPLIQYKVLRQTPMLVGLGEGASMLMQHFFDLENLQVDDWVLPIHNKQINSRKYEPGLSASLHHYRLLTPWFALSQKNFSRYNALPDDEQEVFLERVLRNNMLSFFKGIGHWVEGEINAQLNDCRKVKAKFKNRTMLMFLGNFTTNAVLPDHVGLGQSVARGYGTIERTHL
ncbi:CRISPR-associated endonuclease Cas6 [Lewinella cohaerens]|uniref:CRISPR-associated endonuclease Cas6 n=1 Tax=Lewinella cohaerens TaxID=70995 RepID=UPI00037460D6|nr:CRISPR-associated endonuclease Cas6 [Lewinella cohaerens]